MKRPNLECSMGIVIPDMRLNDDTCDSAFLGLQKMIACLAKWISKKEVWGCWESSER